LQSCAWGSNGICNSGESLEFLCEVAAMRMVGGQLATVSLIIKNADWWEDDVDKGVGENY
jgi:hypothetical protein